MGGQMDTIQLAMAGIQDWWRGFLPLLARVADSIWLERAELLITKR